MKKIAFLLFLAFPALLLFGCGPKINPVHTLTELETEIARVSAQFASGTLTSDQALEMVEQLESKYDELTEKELGSQIDKLKNMIAEQQDKTVKLGELPSRAKDLGLTLPQKMRLNKAVSKQTRVNDQGYDSFTYVYKGPYAWSMKEAARIASGAGLTLSEEVAQAQSLLKSGTAITGLDTSNLTQGIVYTNHNLTDTKIDYLLTVSVEADGSLTIEATNYQQMKSAK